MADRRWDQGMNRVNRDVRSQAECTIGVYGTILVVVRDLYDTEDDDHEDAEQCEDNPPWTLDTALSVVLTHAIQL